MKENYIPERTNYIINEGQVFIIMPFKQMLTYEKIIKPIGEELKLKCIIGGSIFEEGILLSDIVKSISESEFVIADLTGKNPNVFYELGIAHQLRKQVVIITQDKDDVPSDLKGHKWTLYNTNSKEGIINLEKKIRDSFENLFLPRIIIENKKTSLISNKRSNESYLDSNFIKNDEGTFIIWAHLSASIDLEINLNRHDRAWKYLFSHSGNSGEPIDIIGENEKGKEVTSKIRPNMLAIVNHYERNGEIIDKKWRFSFNNGQSVNQIIECGNDFTTEPGWHLLTFTWSKANDYVKLFIDGKSIGTKDMKFWPTKPETKIVIGTWVSRKPSHYYDNKVGPWKLWNKALTIEDIEEEYKYKSKLD